MSDKPRRSWFRFSLRTLLILMTLVCCWLAWESAIVRQRKALLAQMQASGAFTISKTPATWTVSSLTNPKEYPRPATIPWVRRCLGDEAIQYVSYFNVPPEIDLQRVKRTFPETQFIEVHPEPCHPGCFPRGTVIDTPAGKRAVENIAPGDLVTAIARDGTAVSLSVQSVFVTQNKLLTIDTDAGQLLTTQTQPLAVALGETRAPGDLSPGDTILRYEAGNIVPATILSISSPGPIEKVFNLVLGNRELFVAGGFLARSKPPAE
jgi:hypothetical protein